MLGRQFFFYVYKSLLLQSFILQFRHPQKINLSKFLPRATSRQRTIILKDYSIYHCLISPKSQPAIKAEAAKIHQNVIDKKF